MANNEQTTSTEMHMMTARELRMMNEMTEESKERVKRMMEKLITDTIAYLEGPHSKAHEGIGGA